MPTSSACGHMRRLLAAYEWGDTNRTPQIHVNTTAKGWRAVCIVIGNGRCRVECTFSLPRTKVIIIGHSLRLLTSFWSASI